METIAKENLIVDLENAFQEVVDWVNSQSEEHLNKVIYPDKWTAAGHVFHLVKSTKSVTKGMQMNKLALRTMFGKNNRTEKTYEQTLEKYNNGLANLKVQDPVMAAKISAPFSAEPGRTFEKEVLLKRFNDELVAMKKALQKWNETDLTKYIMPHPALGKMTIREFVYFTIFHTKHHLKILREQYS